MHRLMILLKKFVRCLDRMFHTNLFGSIKGIRDAWYGNRFMNALRRLIFPCFLKLRFFLFGKPSKRLRLHLGCGNHRLKGYQNIDWRKTIATDLVCDIRYLPYPPCSVERIELYHVIEHLSRADFECALKNWHKLLVDRGVLVIECPDFDAAVKDYLIGREERLNNIFGWQRFDGDAHRHGYNFSRLESILAASGFSQVRQEEPLDYHKNEEPCIRVECLKEN